MPCVYFISEQHFLWHNANEPPKKQLDIITLGDEVHRKIELFPTALQYLLWKYCDLISSPFLFQPLLQH